MILLDTSGLLAAIDNKLGIQVQVGAVAVLHEKGTLTVAKSDGMSFALPSHRLIGYGIAMSLWQHPAVARGGSRLGGRFAMVRSA